MYAGREKNVVRSGFARAAARTSELWLVRVGVYVLLRARAIAGGKIELGEMMGGFRCKNKSVV